MNWRRGLIRAWVALSAVWLLVAGVFAINDWVEYSDSARATWAFCRMTPDELKALGWKRETWCSNRWEFAPPNPFAQFGGIPTPSLLTEAGFTLAPPLVVLAFGFVVGWILRGFSKSN